jgi:hypothetical protein
MNNNYISQYKTSKYITLFSTDAIKTTNSEGTNNVKFSWTFNNLNLSAYAKIGLVNIVSNSTDNTLINFYCPQLLNDGYSSFSAYPTLYSSRGLISTNITNVLFHNLNAQNLGDIDIWVGNGVPTNSSDKYNGILTSVQFAITLHVIDIDMEQVQPNLISANLKPTYEPGNKSIIKPQI